MGFKIVTIFGHNFSGRTFRTRREAGVALRNLRRRGMTAKVKIVRTRPQRRERQRRVRGFLEI